MIKDTLDRLNSELPATVKLVAVSKFHPFESILEAYEAGQRAFAESRPQEFAAKVARAAELRREHLESVGTDAAGDSYLDDIEWHFIGHLQTNKLKMVLPYASLVQSVDSLHLLEAIDKWGMQNSKVTDILLECHISSDAAKQGFSEAEVEAFVSSRKEYPYVHIRGVMGMATLTDDENIIRDDFARLVRMHDLLQDWIGESPNLPHQHSDHSIDNSGWTCSEISMGMSEDYPIAVETGSTMVRIGSMIFGPRQY